MTGLLLAEQSTTSKQPEAQHELDPLHRTDRHAFAASRYTPPVNHPVTGAPDNPFS